MHEHRPKHGQFRTGEKAGIWLALSLALGLHAIFLLLPVIGETPHWREFQRPIEIELTTVRTAPPVAAVAKPEQAKALPETLPEPVPEPISEPPENPPETATLKPRPPPPATGPVSRHVQRDLDRMSDLEKSALTSTILARQYITEESAADRLFGKPLVQDSSDFQKEFHYPPRPNLLEMLDKPLPDVPFAYTPDLVYFAYEPGIKGDMQRFWDVITPEFGWRTRYGTEVKCALILVFVGCAWK